MKKKPPKDKLQIIVEIREKLDRVEELMSFTIRASDRFKKGQRVQFNAKADKSLVSSRRKGGVRTGRVVSVGDSFSMTVLLDGYKKPSGYHHSFFDPIGKKR